MCFVATSGAGSYRAIISCRIVDKMKIEEDM